MSSYLPRHAKIPGFPLFAYLDVLLKNRIAQLLADATDKLHQDGLLPEPIDSKSITVERARDNSHGDFASNLAMTLAKKAKRKPRDLAEALVTALAEDRAIEKVEIAGPGFINFFLKLASLNQVIGKVLSTGSEYGRSTVGKGKKILLEYVSANPTGPLHVGHGRGAAYGASLSNILRFRL